MVDYPYDEDKSTDYNYESGYLAGLRAILRLVAMGRGIDSISACIQEQVQLMKSFDQEGIQ